MGDVYIFDPCTKSLKKEEYMNLIRDQQVKSIRKDILGYYGTPSDKVEYYDEFRQDLIDKILEGIEDNYEYDEDLRAKYDTLEDAKKEYPEELKRVLDTEFDHVEYVICIIRYPLEIPAYIKLVLEDYDLTYGQLLYVYTRAYQLVYKLEEEEVGDPGHILGIFNRMKSDGPFGIWGHDITDLAYNGNSTVTEYDKFLTCEFDCDS